MPRGEADRATSTSFDSADDLVAAAYDRVVDEISGAASDAFGRGTDIRSRIARGAVEAIVRVIDDDRRKGRLMFSPKLLSTTLATRRMAATRSLAALTVQTTAGTHHEPTEADVAAAYYRVGGWATCCPLGSTTVWPARRTDRRLHRPAAR